MMFKKPAGVLMFLLVILKVLGAAEADCNCTSSECDCSYQPLYRVPQYLPTTITRLELHANRITTLRLGNLETLELGNNDMTDIQTGTFNPMQQLKTLHLSGNKLTNLRSDMFTGLGNLETLELDNNDMTDIQTGTFNLIPQLGTLRLNNNKLTSLMIRSDMFTGLGNLEKLWLHNNKITDIQTGTFTGLGNLQELTLHHNDMTDIQAGTFNSTPQLRVLQLSNNQIQSIPRNLLANLMQLRDLRLSNNNITTFPFEDLLQMTGTYPFEHQVTCSQPDHLNGLKLIDIDPEDLDMSNCPDPTIMRFERVGDNTLVIGDTLQLICEPSGIPTPDITVILPSGQNTTVGSHGRVTVEVTGRIIMRNVTAADTGLYVCIATNFVGFTFSTLSVHVDLISEEPTIMRFEMVNSDPLVQGEMLILVCQASGIPTPDITVILPSGLNATVQSVGRVTVDVNGTVIITDVTAAGDAGLYVCIAANSVGSKFAVLDVDITPAPMASFSLPVLLGATCGSIAGTFLIVSIILAFWCKRNNRKPPIKGPDFSVLPPSSSLNTKMSCFLQEVQFQGKPLDLQMSETPMSSDGQIPPISSLLQEVQLRGKLQEGRPLNHPTGTTMDLPHNSLPAQLVLLGIEAGEMCMRPRLVKVRTTTNL
ncbi:hypothetical protein Bbelb_122030 [Branchiostoma belcheri]|nr:hypothetical protein Bbelb_122030 [Branchiostoma belcheri]